MVRETVGLHHQHARLTTPGTRVLCDLLGWQVEVEALGAQQAPVSAPGPPRQARRVVMWQRLAVLAPLLAAVLLLTGPEPGYDEDRARQDAQTILRARGKDYLDARARLEANPEPSTKALMEKLGEPLGPAERRRVLSILSGFHTAELVPDVRGPAAQGATGWPGHGGRGEPCCSSRGRSPPTPSPGSSRTASWPTEDRVRLLDDLVSVMPGERLVQLVATLGRGDHELRAQLRRSLARRGKQNATDAAALRSALDETITNGEPRQRAEAISVRAALSEDTDQGFDESLVRQAADDATAFVVRVASIRALGDRTAGAGEEALAALARKHLAREQRGQQASEILGWLALRSLPRPSAGRIADELGLLQSDAPRLAAAAYEVGTLPEGDWLARSQTHAWPQVRAAALGRVEGPCPKETSKTLATIGGPVSAGGEQDATVARAAIVALGRCGDPAALAAITKLLENDGITYEQRGEAARQLVEHGTAEDADRVAKLLVAAPPALAERLAGALSRAREPSETVRSALCVTIRETPNAAATARRTFDGLFAGQRCPDAG